MAAKRKAPPASGPADTPLAKAKSRIVALKENGVPIRRSERSTKGQGGELQQKQTISEAVQPRQGLLKQKKSYVQEVPSNAMINPMAPMPRKRSKRSKADVFPTPTQGVPMPVVIQPLSSIIPSHTKRSSNNRDSRFGFHLPPRHQVQDAIVPPLVAVSSNAPSDSDSSDKDTVDNFEVEDVIGGSNSSDDESEPVPGPSKAHRNPDNSDESDTNGDQDIGAEYGTHHDRDDPTLVPGFDQSPSEDEEFAQAQLRSPGEPKVAFENSANKGQKRGPYHKEKRTSQRNLMQNAENSVEGDGSYDVVERHYQKNRAPIPPDPRELEKVLSQNGDDASEEADVEVAGADVEVAGADVEVAGADVEVAGADVKGKQSSNAPTDDEEKTPRVARRHSRKPFTGTTSDPKKLSFYPPQWRDVLGRAQRLWRCWIATECCFPKREAHLDVAMECVVMALSQHQENKGKVEKGFWEEYQGNMRDYIFADRSTFRGLIKNKAMSIVQHLYDFHPKEAFNNQHEHFGFISTAIQNLVHKGNFLSGGRDSEGRTNNLTHPAVEAVSILIYKLVSSKLPAQDVRKIPCGIVALAAAIIRCCLDTWELGWQGNKDFTAEQYEPTYNNVLTLIEALKQDPYHWKKFTAARRAWVDKAKVQARPHERLATGMEICLD